tara:strand:- start:1796 stop:2386 length:591 start_codon:yes stop_codon:yes gene_type:complete
MVNKTTKFDANFTAGGILFQEFISMMDIIENKDFIDLMDIEAKDNAFIGIPVESSRKRIISEIKRRYANAPKNFWSHFKHWNESEKKLGLYYLCLKTYSLVYDIHFEVVLKNFKLGRDLDDYDVQMRFDELSSMDDDFGSWADITIYKLNVQIRKALKDAGLYDGKKLNIPRQIGYDFKQYFNAVNEMWFISAVFI